MGASGWDYLVAYQPDLGAALKALHDAQGQPEEIHFWGSSGD